MMFSMSRSTTLQMMLADTLICEFISHGLKFISHLFSCLPMSSFVTVFGERQAGKGNGWLQKKTEHQDHKEHPQSPGEGNHSGGSWEEGKPPALDNQRAGVASSQSTSAVPHCPPCPMGVTKAGAKLAEQSRVLGYWLLPFPAQHLEQSHLQLCSHGETREQGPARASTAQLSPACCPCPQDCGSCCHWLQSR